MKILNRKIKKISRWLALVEKNVKFSTNDNKLYHSFKTYDYITIIAQNECGKISVVKQFRPAREKYTLEFPAGLYDKNISINQIIKEELIQETGLVPISRIKFICKLSPDTGRMENDLLIYFVKTKIKKNKGTEKKIKHFLFSQKKINKMIISGKFNHALHVAAYHMAVKKGFINAK
jgi:ADP-ribose pyrophosphatase